MQWCSEFQYIFKYTRKSHWFRPDVVEHRTSKRGVNEKAAWYWHTISTDLLSHFIKQNGDKSAGGGGGSTTWHPPISFLYNMRQTVGYSLLLLVLIRGKFHGQFKRSTLRHFLANATKRRFVCQLILLSFIEQLTEQAVY